MQLNANMTINTNLSRWLNSFRGLAALAVVLAHTQSLLFKSWTVNYPTGSLGLAAWFIQLVSRGGTASVMIFFVLSGYLVGGKYLISEIRGLNSHLDFVVARLSRMWTVIIPALILTFVLDSISLKIFNGQYFVDARYIFFNNRSNLWDFLDPATFLCNCGFMQVILCKQYGSNLSLWSLSNEGLYYAIWFGIVAGLYRRVFILIPVSIAFIITFSLLFSDRYHIAFEYLIYFFVWIGGAIAYAVGPIKQRWPMTLLFTSIIMICIYKSDKMFVNLFIAVAFIGILKLLELRNTPHLFLPASRALAEMSFSLYVTHLPVLVIFLSALGLIAPQDYKWYSVIMYFTCCSVCLLFGILFWFIFERQTKKVRHFLTDILSRWSERLKRADM